MRVAASRRSARRGMRGLSLVELMVGVTLGLFLLAGVASVFTSTGQVNRSNQNLARLQESARIAFSLIERDLREAGLNDCGRAARVTNLLNNAALTPMLNWGANLGVVGFDGGVAAPAVASGAATGLRVAGTDAVHVMSGGATGLAVAAHNPAGTIVLGTPSQFQNGDLAIVCDFAQASILQINAVAGRTLSYVAGGATPGNCALGLGFSNDPCGANKTVVYPANSTVMAFESLVWYVGNNGRPETGGRSLYRQSLRNAGAAVAPVAEEVVEGVSDLEFQYLVAGAANYVDATAVAATDWPNVISVRVHLTLSAAAQELSATGTMVRIEREFFNVVALRNRVS